MRVDRRAAQKLSATWSPPSVALRAEHRFKTPGDELARTEDPRSHRTDRNSQHRRDLGVGFALDFIQKQSLREVRLQLRQGALYRIRYLGCNQRAFGLLRIGDAGLERVSPLFRRVIAEQHVLRLALQMPDRNVGGDSIQPRVKSTLAAKCRQPAVGADESLLYGVLYVGGRFQVAGYVPREPPLIFDDKRLERAHVVRLREPHQFHIGVRILHRGSAY